MAALRSRLLLWAIVLAPSCQGTKPLTDQRPAFVPAQQLASTRWVGTRDDDAKLSMASAVVVGPRHLVTAAHFWTDATPWSSEPLPPEREILILKPGPIRALRLANESSTQDGTSPLAALRFKKAASGESTLEAEPEGEWTEASKMDSDWVLVETGRPTWTMDEVAPVYPPAMDPAWHVPEGTMLYVVGFSPIFMDVEAEDPEPDQEMMRFLQEGPYVLAGVADTIDGMRTIEFEQDWPTPKGHSGGGVYLWCEERGRLELVGLFHMLQEFKVTHKKSLSLLGIPSISLGWESTTKKQRMVYSQIASALPALRQAKAGASAHGQ